MLQTHQGFRATNSRNLERIMNGQCNCIIPWFKNQLKGMNTMKRLEGKRFGRLTVLSFHGKNKYNRSMWLCQCDCGNKKVISSNSLQQGLTRSCGCLDLEKHITNPNRTTHGFSGSRIYRIWKAMKNRCNNPNSNDYQKWYGSKGIRVCPEWNDNFWKFYNWSICHGYKDNLTIDRINPDGNYEPSNCRWTTAKVQANNKRKGGDSN
jgi:hypothetical protein